MRPRSAAILACRIIALVTGLEAIVSMILLIAISSDTGEAGGVGPFWAAMIARLVIAVALWRFAEDLSRPMTAGTADDTTESALRAVNIAAIAFSVVGVVFVTEAVTGLIATAASSSGLSSGTLSGVGGTVLAGRGAAALQELIRGGIGVLLIV